MNAVDAVLIVVWAMFWLYWLVTAFSMKRGKVRWSRELLVRVVIVAVVFALVRAGAFREYAANREAWRDALGLVLLFVGLGFAVWARANIGSNWGSPMTRKADPELVTSGPYHLVRHPIYSGVVVALVGTAAALSWSWVYAAGIAGLYFGYSATVEERDMTTRFPDAYPAYRRSTKWFVPFVL
jgi:protein-S-isoprenylcysteine O-methyltransferase Ste14